MRKEADIGVKGFENGLPRPTHSTVSELLRNYSELV
jgi:hypothetical protein